MEQERRFGKGILRLGITVEIAEVVMHWWNWAAFSGLRSSASQTRIDLEVARPLLYHNSCSWYPIVSLLHTGSVRQNVTYLIC